MNFLSAFSTDYESARNGFHQLSQQLTDRIKAYPVMPDDQSLTIDVAQIGDPDPKNTLIISSGLHGVEGLVGSAIQFAFLRNLIDTEVDLKDCSILLIHAINPYGFKHIRRVNEDNIDLNRNFLADFNRLPESGEYSKYNRLLNPSRAITRLDMFALKACFHICRHGTASLRQTIAAGQYQFPDGLFYGGRCQAQSTQLVRQIIQNSSSAAENVIHVDIHSGLGNYADYKILLSRNRIHHDSDRYLSRLDPKKVEIIGQHRGITSNINGTISDYLSHSMKANYIHLGLEFGTYSNLKILKLMRLENAAHQFLNKTDARRKKIKAAFQACFCPDDSGWRNRVIYDGLNVIRAFF